MEIHNYVYCYFYLCNLLNTDITISPSLPHESNIWPIWVYISHNQSINGITHLCHKTYNVNRNKDVVWRRDIAQLVSRLPLKLVVRVQILVGA